MSWVHSFHDEFLMHTLLVRKDIAELDKDIAFVMQSLNLSKGSVLLDQCCGIGSMAIPLSQRGLEVIGVDITPSYIQQAKEKETDACNFYCADARSFHHTDCDAVLNWWTGFGYFDSDSENKKLIEQAFASLRSGGMYLLDVPNMAGIIRHFQPVMLHTYQTQLGTIELERTTTLDLFRSRMEKEWIYRKEGVLCAQHHSSVRLYGSHELVSMFQEAGFSDIQLLGTREGAPLSIDHLRCICIGRKP